MSSRKRKALLILPALLLVLPLAAYWLLDTWLESAGGRRMLEQALTERAAMNVRLNGEFDLMLLPDIGVSGTGLLIGDSTPGAEFVSSREYEISVALKPLFDKQVVIDWIRLTGGKVYPGHYSPREGSGDHSGDKPLQIPQIRELTIRDFQIILPDTAAPGLQVKELKISEFAAGRDTPFVLEIENLVAAEGSFSWDPAESLLSFAGLELDLAGQAVTGIGCLFLQEPRSLHFELEAGELDLDVLQENLPGTSSAGSAGGADWEMPIDLRIRLTAGKLHGSGTVATGVVLNLGEDPACP